MERVLIRRSKQAEYHAAEAEAHAQVQAELARATGGVRD